jgi:chemotaxis protein MotB
LSNPSAPTDEVVLTSPIPVLEEAEEKRNGGPGGSAAPAPPSTLAASGDDEPAQEGAPAWMLTFGDMMSLLLTFFILLYSMSSMETEKFKLASLSLREALGADTGEQLISEEGPAPGAIVPLVTPESDPGDISDETEEAMEEIARRLQEFVTENRLEDMVAVNKEVGGVYLRIQDMALFQPGSTQLEDVSVAVIEQLGDITKAIEAPLVVTGHTDNTPIRSPVFASNWELSAARAAGVARVLVEGGHLPDKVTVEAYGEHRPLGSNETPEGRAQNRRVELYYSRQNIESAILGVGAADARDGTGEADGTSGEVPTTSSDDEATTSGG